MTKKLIKDIHIKLTDHHLKRLALGHGILVHHHLIHSDGHKIYLGTRKHAKLLKNVLKKKGTKIHLDEEEMKANGIHIEGGKIHWKHIGKVLKSGARAVAKVYREHIRPVVGKHIKNIVEEGLTDLATGAVEGALTYAGQPELAAIAAPTIRKGVKNYVTKPTSEFIRKQTGLYEPSGEGMKKKRKSKRHMESLGEEIHEMEYPKYPEPQVFKLQNNYSPFIAPNHPAFWPTLPYYPDNSIILVGDGFHVKQKGCGLYVSRGHHGGGIKKGRPTEPIILDLHDNSYPL